MEKVNSFSRMVDVSKEHSNMVNSFQAKQYSQMGNGMKDKHQMVKCTAKVLYIGPTVMFSLVLSKMIRDMVKDIY